MRYRSLEGEVDAIWWTDGATVDDVKDWVRDRRHAQFDADTGELWLWNGSAVGWTWIPFGGWIVRSGNPEHYWPLHPNRFAATYEPVPPACTECGQPIERRTVTYRNRSADYPLWRHVKIADHEPALPADTATDRRAR